MTTLTAPRIYVGTYAKYNNGSIQGAWLEMDDYATRNQFEAACQALHGAGEHEYMFQDHEGIPDGMISESSLSPDFWEWIRLSDYDKQIWSIYRANIESSSTFENAQDSFMGVYKSPEDWAIEHLDNIGDVPEHLKNYIDYEGYARDAGYEGYVFVRVNHDEYWVFY